MNEIAIVGMAARFPGAPDVDSLWGVVRDGRGALACAEHDSPASRANSGILAGPECGTDAVADGAGAVSIEPGDGAGLDRQHRLLLECAWAAVESSGYAPGHFPGSAGLFTAGGPDGHRLGELLSRTALLDQYAWSLLTHTHDDPGLLDAGVNRLGLREPVVVQTTCPTTLVALHTAAQSLLAFECDVALAGGVEPGTDCAGIVALRRLADAVADGDMVLAVIRGSAIGHYDEVAGKALAAAGADPATVELLQVCGTGVAERDSIEVEALSSAYRSAGRRGWCRLASVPADIGNCDIAAGVAGLIIAVRALQTGWLPPLAGSAAAEWMFGSVGMPFHLASAGARWSAGPEPRRAGVSSIAVGGTSAHVVLEEAGSSGERDTPAVSGPALMLVSAATATAADAAMARLGDHLDDRTEADRHDAAHTLVVARHRLPHRRALVAGPDVVPSAGVATERAPRVVFCFPAAGSQYAGMAGGLLAADARFAVFRAAFREIATALADNGGPDVSLWIDPAADPAALGRPTISSPIVLAVEVALARQLLSWGIVPSATIGHSLGEHVCALLAGVLDLDEMARLVIRRSELLDRIGGDIGAMAAVSLSERELGPYLGGELSLAAVNADDECLVSGPRDAVDELARRLVGMDVSVREVGLATAAHSSLLDPVLDEFAAVAAEIPARSPTVPYASNLTGGWVTDDDLRDPTWWVRHLRGTVRFSDGLATVLADGPAVVMEVGPGRALARYARRNDPAPVASVSLLRHRADQTPDVDHLLGTLGRLWTVGLDADWDEIVACSRRRVSLPSYPFTRAGSERVSPPPRSVPAAEAEAHPAIDTLAAVIDVWADILGVKVGPHDDFFLLGGESMDAVRVVNRLRGRLGVQLGVDALVRTRTPVELAAAIDESSADHRSGPRCLVPINPTGHRRPFFVVHGAGGNVLFLWTLGRHLSAGRPLFGLQAHGSEAPDTPDETIEAMAARYADAIRTVQPHGPYLLGGYSGGGVIALEIAEMFRGAGEVVDLVVMFDTYKPIRRPPSRRAKIVSVVRNSRSQGLAVGAAWFKRWVKRRITLASRRTDEDLSGIDRAESYRAAVRRYQLRTSYTVDAVLLRASAPALAFDPDYDWGGLIAGRFEVRTVDGDHLGLFAPAHAPALAAEVNELLEAADRARGRSGADE